MIIARFIKACRGVKALLMSAPPAQQSQVRQHPFFEYIGIGADGKHVIPFGCTAYGKGAPSAGGRRPITIIELHPFEEKTQTMKMR